MTNSKTKQILARVKKDNVRLIEMQFSDLLGRVKSVTITTEQLAQAFEHGVWFDGSSIEGFARIAESDMVLHPDLDTYALLSWWTSYEKGAVARFICDVGLPGGKPFSGDPRRILKNVLQEAHSLGFTYNVGPELEFFLFKRDEADKTNVYSRGNGDFLFYQWTRHTR